jgi:hypothetical protein
MARIRGTVDDHGDAEPAELVERWGKRARRSESAHYQAAARLELWHALLTGTAVVLSAVTASGLFASSGHNSGAYRIFFGVLGILAAIVGGLDRGQRFAERSEKHRQAGAMWSVVVNNTEEFSLTTHRLVKSDFDGLRKVMDDTTSRSPQLPQRIFVRSELEATYLYPHYGKRRKRRSLWHTDRDKDKDKKA